MSNPYALWDQRKHLGVLAEIKPVNFYWLNLFQLQINSDDEWIDFEKLPANARGLAPFVKPLIAGKPVFESTSSAFRFKPAYIKASDPIDPLMPLVRRAGIDKALLTADSLSPTERLELIRLAIKSQHVTKIKRTWEWMSARGVIDGQVTISGDDYPTTLLDFNRDPSHTVVLGPGVRWGEAGVSIMDNLQAWNDRMFTARHGGYAVRLTVGSKAWAVMRKDEEFMKHMDTNTREPRATIERGLVSSDPWVKVGEILVGGNSGVTIEVILYRDEYDVGGTAMPFMNAEDIVLTASAEAVQGYRCYGAIIDRNADYKPFDIFGRSWVTQGDPQVEHMLDQSAPLMVPVNPNATFKATVVAP